MREINITVAENIKRAFPGIPPEKRLLCTIFHGTVPIAKTEKVLEYMLPIRSEPCRRRRRSRHQRRCEKGKSTRAIPWRGDDCKESAAQETRYERDSHRPRQWQQSHHSDRARSSARRSTGTPRIRRSAPDHANVLAYSGARSRRLKKGSHRLRDDQLR